MSKSYEIEQLINGLYRNYPTWPSTFSVCECKRNLGRGGGKCADCIEDDLAQLIEPELANDIHVAIRHLATLRGEALAISEEAK